MLGELVTRAHPKAFHFPKWAILNIKWAVLKLKLSFRILSFIAFRIIIKSLPKVQEMAFSETVDFKISRGRTPHKMRSQFLSA